MNNILHKYQNGDYTFTLHDDGTLIRETDVENPVLIYPSSMDVKITDYCDMGCNYCHEMSTEKGKHGDLNKLLYVIKDLYSGTELALGGGNPLSHPDLVRFLNVIKNRGIVANITVNQGHLKVYQDLLTYLIKDNLVKGVGISITNNNFNYIKPLLEITDNIVYHVIAGVNKVEVIDQLIELGNCKVLILGYKKFGFGINHHSPEIDNEIKRWYTKLPKYLNKCTLSFDNLAIEQLNVRRLFTTEGWEKFFMGEDFCFTMYLDAIKQQYAPTSRSSERKSFDECSLLEYFSTRNKTTT